MTCDGCAIDQTPCPGDTAHCAAGWHCVQTDATCAGSSRVDDHAETCCHCSARISDRPATVCRNCAYGNHADCDWFPDPGCRCCAAPTDPTHDPEEHR